MELAGNLGIKENLAANLIGNAMNDIGVWPAQTTSMSGDAVPPTKIPSSENKFPFGFLQMQTDFTITTGINGGPNWTLTKFKGPSAGGGAGAGGGGAGAGGAGAGGAGGSQGLLNASRRVQDTLVITFIPICIREKYELSVPILKYQSQSLRAALGVNPPKPGALYSSLSRPLQDALLKNPPYAYYPEMVQGTPGWANYLKPCALAGVSKSDAVEKAHDFNVIIQQERSRPPVP
jgi:hypothetical protein